MTSPDTNIDPHADCKRKIADLMARLLTDGPKSLQRISVVRMDQHGVQQALHVRDVYENYSEYGLVMIVVS